jgi:hypothetical protein
MSGETAKSESGWSVDTLKEFVLALLQQVRGELAGLIAASEKRLDAAIVAAAKAAQERFESQQQGVKDALTAQKEATASALVSAEKAVLVAENSAEKWRMNANEWRGSMLDRETRFAQRTEVEAELKSVRAEIASLKETRAEGIGSKAMMIFLITLLGAAATIIGIVIAMRG